MVKFTLHDVFGYLFPGVVMVPAIGILARAFSQREFDGFMKKIFAPDGYTWPAFILLLFGAYILGTIVPPLAQRMKRAKKMKDVLSDDLIDRLEDRVGQILGPGWDKEKCVK